MISDQSSSYWVIESGKAKEPLWNEVHTMSLPVFDNAKPGTCFSCERYIGPADVCPYCGADAARAPALRALRYAALVLTVAGLAWLSVSARHREPPVVAIGRIAATMNFARIRIVGEVQRNAYVSPRRGEPDYFSFVVADDSGEVRVQAWRDVAAALAAADRVPSQGDRVEVEGRVRISARGDPRLALDSEQDVRFQEGPAP